MTQRIIKTVYCLEYYRDASGKEPVALWLKRLPLEIEARIRKRLQRLEEGNKGDCESVGGGVFELRMFFGSGYRLYFAEHGTMKILLLSGGDKSSQRQDIAKAKAYWEEYKENRT